MPFLNGTLRAKRRTTNTTSPPARKQVRPSPHARVPIRAPMPQARPHRLREEDEACIRWGECGVCTVSQLQGRERKANTARAHSAWTGAGAGLPEAGHYVAVPNGPQGEAPTGGTPQPKQ